MSCQVSRRIVRQVSFELVLDVVEKVMPDLAMPLPNTSSQESTVIGEISTQSWYKEDSSELSELHDEDI